MMVAGQQGRIELATLLTGLEYKGRGGVAGRLVASVTSDSRQVGPGAVFVAVRGEAVDGHVFIDEAISKGCVALVVEAGHPLVRARKAKPAAEVCWIQVADSRSALGQLVAAFFGHPAAGLRLIGVTGTNGKTTTSYLLESMIKESGGRPGVIGTVNYRFGATVQPAELTTPGPVRLHELLRRMADDGVTHVIMEVSSHALSQDRLHGLRFDVALFTNLSRDHLDFHGDMATYFASKKKLFTHYLKEDGTAVVINWPPGEIDGGAQPDEINWGRQLIEELRGSELRSAAQAGVGRLQGERRRTGPRHILECGVREGDVCLGPVHFDNHGITAAIKTPVGSWELRSRLVGEFNLKNLLGGVGVGVALGLDRQAACRGLARVEAVPGRLERVASPAAGAIFVDYAHTPDAMENVLRTLATLEHRRLIVVFGCGGDRDVGKRPIMGQVAGRLADVVLLTSDNPRSEDPGRILGAIERGLTDTPLRRGRAEAILARPGTRGYDVVESRRAAIEIAVRFLAAGDILLISGKGHENYQITRTGQHFFDDRVEVRRQACQVRW